MENAVAITRVMLRNYKSIGNCDVRLGALTWLVGANGTGKSNFLDALHFVKDALVGSLDNALNERGGLNEVRRRSNGHPMHFTIRVEFLLKDGRQGYYAFTVGATQGGAPEVQQEECAIDGKGKGPFFQFARGQMLASSEPTVPAFGSDRLALVAAAGLGAFRPVYDVLTATGFYNLNPKMIRELQKPQDGRLLKPAGENIASVLSHLERVAPGQLDTITEYLHTVVPSVTAIKRIAVGPMESIEFFQPMSGAKHPWRFYAQNMSDGTLRALAILTALFQGNRDYTPTLIGIEEPETALHPAASAALREALVRAAQSMQVIVTSHSPELLNDFSIDADALLVVTSEGGETHITPIDQAARESMGEKLFSAGELLRMNQLAPDERLLHAQPRQGNLFADN